MTKLIFVSLILFSSIAGAQPRDDHARFSGKRLAVEIIGGELTGALVTGLTFNALCNGQDCLGSAFAAFGANFAVTPLAVWGVGAAMGGEGSLGYSYLGASLALTPFSITGSADESPSDTLSRVSLEAWMSSILLAPCSALMYEVSSHGTWMREHQVNVAVRTLHDRDGAIGMISGRW